MKKSIYILLAVLAMSGCSYKNEPIALKPYEANYKTPISKKGQSKMSAQTKRV